MNRQILRLAIPNIITNITIPLLGMVDMAVVGRCLGSQHIGAIAIGTQIFNLIYWNFGFLRMGTSGFTAQAYGAERPDEMIRIFVRAFLLAEIIAFSLIALQYPIGWISEQIFHGSEQVMHYALDYFYVRIWAAPATLGLYAIKGWFIGMQNAKLPMWISISMDCINIAASILLVVVCHMGIRGVALGTVIAQYSGMAIGIVLLVVRYGEMFRRWLSREFVAETIRVGEMKKFFKVNGDIFLRTICLVIVFTFITAESGRISDMVLSVDALLMYFFTLFSYVMDGFAYAGESLVGRYIGAQDGKSLRKSVRYILYWGVVLTGLFTAAYAIWGSDFIHIFSKEEAVIAAAEPYMFWILLVPVCGFSAFLFDGIFVGATASRAMRNSMFIATLLFFGLYYGVRLTLTVPDENSLNNLLWGAFMIYLIGRGLGQAVMLRHSVFAQVEQE